MIGDLSGYPFKDIIDAEGAIVTPGGVDAHVHLTEPLDLFGKISDDFEAGTRSAVAGGTTTIIAFASQDPNDDGNDALLNSVNNCKDHCSKNLYCDYGLHLIMFKIKKTNLEEQLIVLAEKGGVTSIKLYMTYPKLQLRDYDLMTALNIARKCGITVMLHAENGDMIQWMIDSLEEQGKTDPYFHAVSRPSIFEGEATNRAIVMSEALDAPLLFVHVSAPEAIKAIHNAQSRGLKIFAETCPQYILLKSADLKQIHCHDPFEGAKFLCSPPPRQNDEDLDIIWKALKDGIITIFSSDHCPTKYYSDDGKKVAFKNGHNGEFQWIPNGCPGVETRLSLIASYGVSNNRLSWQKLVELNCTNPAKLYGIYPKKGALIPGLSDADIVIWYPQNKLRDKIRVEDLHSNCDYTPFEGYDINNWPRYTIVKGKVVFKEGILTDIGDGNGTFLHRAKSQLASPRNKWISEWRPSYIEKC
ncbi:uncharacterized protein PRCAT00002473001 [Priceomyces carsonii]|uniref:uncharacterized protein n=1 Tax=Priceomyces carsonii TaxID=28549 RepID=UPI002EDB3277|nr:unnamed protein product [Priceomyces carsonii]